MLGAYAANQPVYGVKTMPKLTEYQGHPSKGHWNVALWLANDEPTYRLAMDAISKRGATRKAAHYCKSHLPDKTPDRFDYSIPRLVAALKGFES